MNEAVAPDGLPETIDGEEQLAELLSRPTAEVVEVFARLEGGLAVVGGGGKIGPSLVKMACRARDAAGTDLEITVIDLFPDPPVRDALADAGAKTVTCDLLDPAAVAKLPPADNVIYMVGMKFGTSENPPLTWAVNALVPAYVARRYRRARIVAFSTGCVYALTPVDGPGSVETDPLEPVGEYSNACVARERVLEFCSGAGGTAMLLVRLNYSVEMRYGVLVDLALKIHAGECVDLTMGYFNVMWQGDVNAAFLRLLEHTTRPASAVNLTGTGKLSIRELAGKLGERMGREVTLAGTEAETALLSDVTQAVALLGPPPTPIDRVLEWTAGWIARGGRVLGKPTHFQQRDGRY